MLHFNFEVHRRYHPEGHGGLTVAIASFQKITLLHSADDWSAISMKTYLVINICLRRSNPNERLIIGVYRRINTEEDITLATYVVAFRT